MKLASAAQMRELDRIAIEERGIPSVQLMETAAGEVARAVMDLAEERYPAPDGRGKAAFLPTARGEAIGPSGTRRPVERDDPRVSGRPLRAAVFCGPGNNGGDGVAAARCLMAAGWAVRAYLVGKREKMTPDCREMEVRLAAKGGALLDFVPGDPDAAAWTLGADVLVDAVFGIGLNAPVRGDALAAIALMNRAPAPTVSADIPSGVCADTGEILGQAVEAVCTVTFTYPKPGHYVGKGGLCAGRVITVPLGIPADLTAGLDAPAEVFVPSPLPRRARDAHKGDFGRAYILGGCVGYTGAPVMAAQAAVRTGAGLVSVGVPAPVWPIAANKLLEAMPHPLSAGPAGDLAPEAVREVRMRLLKCDACLIGPGLGRGEGTARLVRRLLRTVDRPVVLDADGINALAGHIDSLDGRSALTVLTPHDGEFARLTGRAPGADRLGAAKSFAAAHRCFLVLNGNRTITAFPDGTAFVNLTGNPGMAKGGSGDVLAGMILALLAQGLPEKQAVPLAVYGHGLAGDRAAAELGEYGMTPADLIQSLPGVWRDLEQGA